MSIVNLRVTNALHPVSFLRGRLDDQFLVRSFPFFHLWVGIDDGCDIIDDVLVVSSLVVKGDRTGSQMVKHSFDVGLWTASNTDT